jgi:hypothetical protein
MRRLSQALWRQYVLHANDPLVVVVHDASETLLAHLVPAMAGSLKFGLVYTSLPRITKSSGGERRRA